MEMVDFITTATSGIYDIIIKSGLQIIIFIGRSEHDFPIAV